MEFSLEIYQIAGQFSLQYFRNVVNSRIVFSRQTGAFFGVLLHFFWNVRGQEIGAQFRREAPMPPLEGNVINLRFLNFSLNC